MLKYQSTAEARRINPEERKAAARRIARELLEDIPELSVEGPPEPSLPSGLTVGEHVPADDE